MQALQEQCQEQHQQLEDLSREFGLLEESFTRATLLLGARGGASGVQAQLAAELRTRNLVDVACRRWQAGEARSVLRMAYRLWRCSGLERKTPRQQSSYQSALSQSRSPEKLLKAHRSGQAAFASGLIEAAEKASTEKALLFVEQTAKADVQALQEQCKLQNRELEELTREVSLLEDHFAKAAFCLDAHSSDHVPLANVQVAADFDTDTQILFDQMLELEGELEDLRTKMAAMPAEAVTL